MSDYPRINSWLSRDLLRLSLVRNRLTEVPSDALIILKNLNQLDLSDNRISSLQQGTFEGELLGLQFLLQFASHFINIEIPFMSPIH